MATLTSEEIKKILLQKPGQAVLQKSEEINNRLLTLTEGYNLQRCIPNIAYIDNQSLYEAKKTVQKKAVDLYERIIKLRGKVFSAKGGSKVYGNLKEAEEKSLIAYLQKIRNGISLKKYIEQSLLKAWDADPMGICLIELSDDDSNPLPYPTYKNISTIYAIKTHWRYIDFLMLKLDKEDLKEAVEAGLLTEDNIKESGNFLRVIDDIRDVIICDLGSGQFIEFKSSEIPNPWGKVPGFLLSNIPDKENKRMISTLEPIIELAERYIARDADLALQEKLHGTLKFWSHPITCHKCGGSGMVKSEDCVNCNKTGKELNPKLGQTSIVPASDSENKYSTPPFGWAAPPNSSFELIQKRASHYEQLCMDTYWSASKAIKATGSNNNPLADPNQSMDTATEVLATNTKEEITLHLISDWYQETEAMLIDLIAKYFYYSYTSTSVIAGRRYLIKSIEEMRSSYEAAKRLNLAESIKDDAYYDYLQSKYENDPIQLVIQQKLFQLEPFFHFSVSELKSFITDPEVIKRKVFFGEWKKTKSDMELFNKNITALKNDRDVFIDSITVKENTQVSVLN